MELRQQVQNLVASFDRDFGLSFLSMYVCMYDGKRCLELNIFLHLFFVLL